MGLYRGGYLCICGWLIDFEEFARFYVVTISLDVIGYLKGPWSFKGTLVIERDIGHLKGHWSLVIGHYWS